MSEWTYPSDASMTCDDNQASDSRGSGPHVLIVEDEGLVAMDLETILNDLGFANVSIASSLQAGLDAINKERPDFAILDVNLGEALVFPLAAALKAKGVPFFFSTGRRASEIPEEWAAARIAPKPASRQTIARAVRELGYQPTSVH